jgi:hypothetical protein
MEPSIQTQAAHVPPRYDEVVRRRNGALTLCCFPATMVLSETRPAVIEAAAMPTKSRWAQDDRALVYPHATIEPFDLRPRL